MTDWLWHLGTRSAAWPISSTFFTTQGTGVVALGSALHRCTGRASAIQGEIGVKSVPGQGTTFEMLLPSSAPLLPIPAERKEASATPRREADPLGRRRSARWALTLRVLEKGGSA